MASFTCEISANGLATAKLTGVFSGGDESYTGYRRLNVTVNLFGSGSGTFQVLSDWAGGSASVFNQDLTVPLGATVSWTATVQYQVGDSWYDTDYTDSGSFAMPSPSYTVSDITKTSAKVVITENEYSGYIRVYIRENYNGSPYVVDEWIGVVPAGEGKTYYNFVPGTEYLVNVSYNTTQSSVGAAWVGAQTFTTLDEPIEATFTVGGARVSGFTAFFQKNDNCFLRVLVKNSSGTVVKDIAVSKGAVSETLYGLSPSTTYTVQVLAGRTSGEYTVNLGTKSITTLGTTPLPSASLAGAEEYELDFSISNPQRYDVTLMLFQGDTVVETASLGNRAEGTRRFIGLTRKTWYTLRVYASTVKGMVGDLADTISARTLGKTGVTACIGVNGVAKTATPYVVTLVNGVPVWKPYIPKIGI